MSKYNLEYIPVNLSIVQTNVQIYRTDFKSRITV